jgi:hypothetical protein
MYGKPEWFLTNAGRWLVRPSSWQGWAYTIAWVVAMVLPSLSLMARSQVPEAVVWTLLSAGLWLWDSAAIRRVHESRTAKEVFYIGDDTPEVA